jgi:Zn ribbon nucleic-acid-binding protein
MKTTTNSAHALPAPDASAFPDALTGTPHWVGYTWVLRDGKRTKVPKDAHTGRNASTTNPATWTDFATARTFALRHGYGLGFMLAPPFVGVDLDHCRDAATGELSTLGLSVLANLDTYAEVSVSGTGVKAIAYGEKPGQRCRKNGLELEMYSEKRLFALTGQRLDDAPRQVNDCQEYLDHLYTTMFGETVPTPSAPPAFVTDDDDRAVLDWLTTHNPKFAALWAGDTAAYNGDDSAADQALCNMLAFRTGDENRVDQIFRLSGLYRAKWERGDYRHATVTKAMRQRRFFTPSTPPRSTVDRPPVPDDVDPHVAALQQENDRLRQELADERDHRAAVHGVFTNPGMTPAEKLIAYALVFEVASAASRGEQSAADPETYPVNCTAVGQRIGMGHAAVSANITRFAERGQLRKVTTPKATRDGKTFPEVAVRLPGETVLENLRTVATWTRPEGTPHVGGVGHRCPQCASTTTKKTTETKTVEATTLSCAECGHVHTQTRRTVGKPTTTYSYSDDTTPPMLDRAAMRGEPSRSTVDRPDPTPAPDLATVGADGPPPPDDRNTTVERPRVVSRPTPPPTAPRSTVDRHPQPDPAPPVASWTGTHPCSDCGATCYTPAGTVPRCLPCTRSTVDRRADPWDDVAAGDD